jgi:hypothetical protein
MGKSQFKIAADLVIEHCKENRFILYTDSDFYWAYRRFFKEIDSKFDLDKFNDYINKRI